MIEFDRSLRVKTQPSDSDLQDFCNSVRKNMDILVSWKKEPVVTINICAHNEQEFLPWTLESIAHINTAIPVEVLVIDNASTDRTAEIGRECWVRVVRENRKWISYAGQVWLENSKWEFIFSTDADVRVPEMWIDASLKYFNNDSSLVCFSWWIKQPLHPVHLLLSNLPRLIRYLIRTQKSYSAWSFAWWNMVYKRQAAIEAWGYNLWYDQWEDFIFSSKLKNIWSILSLSDENTVVDVSPRRVDTAKKVIELYLKWFWSWSWLDKKKFSQEAPRTFSDIR